MLFFAQTQGSNCSITSSGSITLQSIESKGKYGVEVKESADRAKRIANNKRCRSKRAADSSSHFTCRYRTINLCVLKPGSAGSVTRRPSIYAIHPINRNNTNSDDSQPVEMVMFGSEVIGDSNYFEYEKYYAFQVTVGDEKSYIKSFEATLTEPPCGGRAVEFSARSIDQKPGSRHSDKLEVNASAKDAMEEGVEACTLKKIRNSLQLYPGVVMLTRGPVTRESDPLFSHRTELSS